MAKLKIKSDIYIYIKINKDWKNARKIHQSLSEEEKEKKQQYGCESYKNLSEAKKQKLVEYRKKVL